MSNYRFRNKPIETLNRDELYEALVQALDRLAVVDPPARPLDFSDDRDIRLPPDTYILRRTFGGAA